MARQRGPPPTNTSPDRAGARSTLDDSDVDTYLARIGLDPDTVVEPDLETLTRLQRAHVTTVPFENLAIVGDPFDDEVTGRGIELEPTTLFEMLVERERGGYCFELNGLFHDLLVALGYAVDRVAARVDGGLTVPANHHANVVTLDQRYVVDVGTGVPMIRRPIPFDGAVVRDEVGVEWRLADCDRPDEDHQTEYREPGDEDWATRYVFSDAARDLSYFRATNDYLQTAPESSFTGDPLVQIATANGHRTLTIDALTDPLDADSDKPVAPDDWHAVLHAEFGIHPDTL